MLEKEIEAMLREAVKREGGIAYKFISPGHQGVPDRLIVYPDGGVHFVELKTDTGRVTPLQQQQIGRLEQLQAAVWIVKGLDGLAAYFEEAGKPVALDYVRRRINMLTNRRKDRTP